MHNLTDIDVDHCHPTSVLIFGHVQMRRLGDTIQQEVVKLRIKIDKVQKEVDARKRDDGAAVEHLMEQATEIGDSFMRLEKCAPSGNAGCRVSPCCRVLATL
jgi:hypothetical protein